jgi:hypothetical protein
MISMRVFVYMWAHFATNSSGKLEEWRLAARLEHVRMCEVSGRWY